MSAGSFLFSSSFNPSSSTTSSSGGALGSVTPGGGANSNRDAGRKRKRTSLPASSSVSSPLNSKSVGGAGAGAVTNAYEKRQIVKQGQVNLEKVMKNLKKIDGVDRGVVNGGVKVDSSKSKAMAIKAKRTPEKKDGKKMTSGNGKLQGDVGLSKKSSAKSKKDTKVDGVMTYGDADEDEDKDEDDAMEGISATVVSSESFETPSEPTSTLTSLQQKHASKLSSAKFRWLNEQLYNLPSTAGWDLMRNEGGRAFEEYHHSHREQTAHWPEPPLKFIIASLRSSPEMKEGSLVVDLGCGDAELAKTLSKPARAGGKRSRSGKSHADAIDPADGRKTFKVVSYDLVGDLEPGVEGKGWVVPGDFLTSIPLPGDPGGRESGNEAQGGGPEIVDAVVCCLSLMGVNWVGGIYEAARVLRHG